MKRWFVRALAGVLFLAGIVFLLAWASLRASLPRLDGEIAAAGLDRPATIERDDSGVPTITAASRSDLAYATGFAHGQDRFFQMDLIRRRSAGELAELFGTAALAADKRSRFHRFRARAMASLRAMIPADRQLLEAYARGVNAGVESLGTRPFEYIVVGAEPQAWRPEDSLLVVYAMFMMLNDERATNDVRRGLAHRILPAEVYTWMYPGGTPWDAPLMGEPREMQPTPAPQTYSVRNITGSSPPANEIGKPELNGSNNWAVSGALTASGRALVANDMHLGLSVPNIYYRARLVVTGADSRNITGVTLPGAPFVVAGSNTRIAWGYTNSYGGWADAVLLRPGLAADTYRAPQGEVPFEVYNETILVKGAEPVSMPIRETIWGPVDEDAHYPDGEIAVSWIAHRPEAVNLRLVDLETIGSVNAALDVANVMGIPPQNFVVGDADGNIGWTIAGRIPLRGAQDTMLPVDWSNGGGWSGWLPIERYPRIVNPHSGRLWTANARVADGEALQLIGDEGYDLGARAAQIRDDLFAAERFGPADMLAIQLDDRAVFLARWRDLLLQVLDADTIAAEPQLAGYRRLVEDWVPRASTDSVGYRLVRDFRLEVQARVFYALTGPLRAAYGDDVRLRISNQFESPLWSVVTEQPRHLLSEDYESWHDLMLAAVRANIEYFDANFSGPLAGRSWGERNTAQIRHPLSRSIPILAEFLDMPQDPLAGDVDMPRAQGRNFGASERFSVSPGDEANGLMQMPGGQSGHPLSPFYRRGHEDWVHGTPVPFLPGPTQHKLTLRPSE